MEVICLEIVPFLLRGLTEGISLLDFFVDTEERNQNIGVFIERLFRLLSASLCCLCLSLDSMEQS